MGLAPIKTQRWVQMMMSIVPFIYTILINVNLSKRENMHGDSTLNRIYAPDRKRLQRVETTMFTLK